MARRILDQVDNCIIRVNTKMTINKHYNNKNDISRCARLYDGNDNVDNVQLAIGSPALVITVTRPDPVSPGNPGSTTCPWADYRDLRTRNGTIPRRNPRYHSRSWLHMRLHGNKWCNKVSM